MIAIGKFCLPKTALWRQWDEFIQYSGTIHVVNCDHVDNHFIAENETTIDDISHDRRTVSCTLVQGETLKADLRTPSQRLPFFNMPIYDCQNFFNVF